MPLQWNTLQKWGTFVCDESMTLAIYGNFKVVANFHCRFFVVVTIKYWHIREALGDASGGMLKSNLSFEVACNINTFYTIPT